MAREHDPTAPARLNGSRRVNGARVNGVGRRLPRSFFARPVLEVAPDLLGRVVVHADDSGVVAVRLTEVEAYAGTDDPGSHAYRGPTPRGAPPLSPNPR